MKRKARHTNTFRYRNSPTGETPGMRERGLVTLWCRRRRASAEQMTPDISISLFVLPTIKKLGCPKGHPSFLVRERGLEPPRRNHTHLKRACLPFQHSRSCQSIITAGGKFVNRFFGKRENSKITAGFCVSRYGKAPTSQSPRPEASGDTTAQAADRIPP